MSLHISFELSESDLDYFCGVLLRAREISKDIPPQQLIAKAKQLLTQVDKSDATDFIRDLIGQLETLIAMLTDEGWGLIEDDRERVLNALSYFSEAKDLIPDNIPGLGFLDDAIMIEIVCKALEHEIQAYKDFVVFRSSETRRRADDAPAVEKSNWLEERRKQLHARMRRRRNGQAGRNKTKSPFSLL